MNLSRPILALLAAIFLAAWLIPSATRTLVRPDEGRYTEIAREMAVSGDYVTPTLNGLKYFEKPPLQYWATATAMTTFGQTDFTARWWPAATGLLGLAFVWFAACALIGRERATVATAMLGAMVYYFLISHINTLDMGLTAFMTLTMVGMLRGFGVEGQSGAATRGWMIAAWVGAALAFLSKGLIGIVLPGAVFVIYLLISRQWSLLKRLEWVWGPLAFLAIAAPWPLLVQSRNPEWANFFFIYEHFGRFASEEHDRAGALLYFVPIVIVGLLPWTAMVGSLFQKKNWQTLRSTYARATMNVPLFLAIWCVFIFAFFSISKSKLPSYLLPITPAAALLLAPVLLSVPAKSMRWLVASFVALPVLLFGLAVFSDRFVNETYTTGMVNEFMLYVLAGAIVFALAAVALFKLNSKGRRADALLISAVLATAGCSISASGYESLAASTSSRVLVADFLVAEKQYRNDDPFYTVGMYEQTLAPYLKRTFVLVDYLDEQGLGLAADPSKAWFNFDDFADEWEQLDRGYAVTDFDQLARFDMQGLDYRIVATDLRRVIVARNAR